METSSKVEKAIKTYRKKQKENAGGGNKANEPRKLTTRVVITPIEPAVSHSSTKKDDLMEDFDQFVLFKESEKIKEVLNENLQRSTLTSEPGDCNTPSKVQKSPEVLNNIEDVEEAIKDSTLDGYSGQQVDYEAECSKENEDNSGDEIQEEKVDEEKITAYLFPTPEEISNLKTPEEGMVFPSLQSAVRFVNVYAHVQGFSVIKGRNYKQRKITLMCNKQRHTVDKLSTERQRQRSFIDRTDCKMKIEVKLVDMEWHIVTCQLLHNHDMAPSPSLTKFFLSHRTMSSHEKKLSQLLQQIRVKPQKIMEVSSKMAGGCEKLKFGKRKLDNLKQAERKNKQNSDIKYTLKYIEKLQLTKPGFCCKMEVDSDDAVRSIFWTDGRSRLDYKLYGEIIYFDTTYSTNRYNMPFAPIIGINGHARTIVYGWALLKDQTAITFEWLFESFMEVMEGKKPKLILTDQDQAMRNAIKEVFKEASHRWCLFHILNCLKENCSSYMAKKEGMEDCIVNLIMQSLTVLEFESGWNEMLLKYDCADNEHLLRMWKDRSMFVHAYFKDSFCPFTRTTGRSESFNSNFKDYVQRKDTIEMFLKQYEIFQQNVMEIENEDRFESTQKKPFMRFRQPIEQHAASIYTRGIYKKFLTELLNSTAFAVTKVIKDKVYELRKMFYYEGAEYRRNIFTVFVDRENMNLECECGKFEKDGILCCHILRLFTQWDVVAIPEHYIMPRWTNNFREVELLKHKEENLEIHGSTVTQQPLIYTMLMNSMTDVCADISRDPGKSREFLDEVHKVHKRLMAAPKSKDTNSVILKDPPVIRKASQKNKQDGDGSTSSPVEVSSVSETTAAPVLKNLSIWINADGSTSNPVKVKGRHDKANKKKDPPAKKKKAPPKKKDPSPKKQNAETGSNLKDPPASNSKSVDKGNRMKPQYEINSQKRSITKKRKIGE